VKLIPIIILAIFLQGCGLFKKVPDPSIPPDKVVQVDKAALEQCSLLNENLVISTFEDAVIAYGDLSTMYGTCAGKQAVSVKLLKQFSNIK